MEEHSNSWIRRTKFSHTVCHRLDSSRLRLTSIPPTRIPSERNQGLSLKSRPSSNSYGFSSYPLQRNPITNKQRSVSPLPELRHSETFKEAKSEQKRFSTPSPRRKEHDKRIGNGKRIMGNMVIKDSREVKTLNSKSASNTSPLRHLASMKYQDKSKKGDSAWTKYWDGRVTSVETAEEWTFDLSQLFLGVRFAHGAHSRLYHGIYKDEPVAVKIIMAPADDENNKDLASKLEKQFIREVTLLSRLHHPNVIKLVAACRKPPVYCVVTEYLSEGSLRAYLHKLERRAVPLQKLLAFSLDIARAMEYIHSQGVIHRDLKPENVLISEDSHLKVADFGIACEQVHCDLLADDPGTYRWMAPEMIKRKSYGKKVDVYSFGLILWEMVTGTIPYEDMSPIQAAYAVVNKNMRPVIPSDCPPAMRALIEQCWSLKPDRRPEFWQVVKVLEQFETSLARDGSLNLVQNPCCQDHKKGLLHWIQKLGPAHYPNNTPVPKPKFS